MAITRKKWERWYKPRLPILFVGFRVCACVMGLTEAMPGLDPPLLLYFPRIFVRTIKRWWGLQELCSPGCGETFRDIFLSRTSILWWCLSHHFVVRRRCEKMMGRIGIGAGPNPKTTCMRRIGGWGRELESWLQEVDIMVRKKA